MPPTSGTKFGDELVVDDRYAFAELDPFGFVNSQTYELDATGNVPRVTRSCRIHPEAE